MLPLRLELNSTPDTFIQKHKALYKIVNAPAIRKVVAMIFAFAILTIATVVSEIRIARTETLYNLHVVFVCFTCFYGLVLYGLYKIRRARFLKMKSVAAQLAGPEIWELTDTAFRIKANDGEAIINRPYIVSWSLVGNMIAITFLSVYELAHIVSIDEIGATKFEALQLTLEELGIPKAELPARKAARPL